MYPKPLYQLSGRELEASATQNPHALLQLARLVTHGWRGLPTNEARALELEQHAAAMGYPQAMRRLGDRFNNGDGVDENQQIAFTWWRNAAAAGDADAMSNLIPLMDSENPAEAAEGRRWAELAAAQGVPYAINVLSGGTSATPDMLAFAQMSLEEMAAKATPPSGNELSWSVEEVRGSLAQINDLVGWWLERLRTVWFDVTHTSTADGEDVDFPCPVVTELPDGISSDNNTLEVTIRAGAFHLQLDATLWDEGWNLSLSSFEPHPPPDGQAWLLGELQGVASQLGLRLG
jgi:hypothetical protein